MVLRHAQADWLRVGQRVPDAVTAGIAEAERAMGARRTLGLSDIGHVRSGRPDPGAHFDQEWVPTSTAADLLSVAPRTVRRYVADGKLVARPLTPRTIAVQRRSVDALIRSRTP